MILALFLEYYNLKVLAANNFEIASTLRYFHFLCKCFLKFHDNIYLGMYSGVR